jgi:hypothetical protein
MSRVEITAYGWSLDDLVLSHIPGPSAGALLMLGGRLFSKLRHQK